MDLFKSKNFKPMLLTETKEPFDDEDYLYEIKYDGIRALIFVSPEEIMIKTRNKNEINDIFPELKKIQKQVKKKCIFDGEIILPIDGKPSFETIKTRVRSKKTDKINRFVKEYPVLYVAFDILYEDEDLTNLPLIERKQRLEKYKDTDVFVKSQYVLKNGKKLFEWTTDHDVEGIVAKLKNGPYEINARSKQWIKIKNFKEEEYYIVGYFDNNNNAVASILLATKEKNKYTYAGRVTLGKRRKEYQKIIKVPKDEKRIDETFKEDYLFIKPKLKCSVTFMEKTSSGLMREPHFSKLVE